MDIDDLQVGKLYEVNCRVSSFSNNRYEKFVGQYVAATYSSCYLFLGPKARCDMYIYNEGSNKYINFCRNVLKFKLLQHSLYLCKLEEVL